MNLCITATTTINILVWLLMRLACFPVSAEPSENAVVRTSIDQCVTDGNQRGRGFGSKRIRCKGTETPTTRPALVNIAPPPNSNEEGASPRNHSIAVLENSEKIKQFNYIGNKTSFKFHRPQCDFACAMWTSRRQFFSSKRDALKAGMRPCRWCFPVYWTKVSGQLIKAE